MSSPFVFSSLPVPIRATVTGAATTDVVDATLKAIMVPSFEVNEISGGTGNLTVAIYDGTTSYYLGDDGGTAWNAQAMTARKSYKFTGVYPIPVCSKLRVINSSGNISIIGTKLPVV